MLTEAATAAIVVNVVVVVVVVVHNLDRQRNCPAASKEKEDDGNER